MMATSAVLVLTVDENGDGQWQWSFPEMTQEQKRALDRLWMLTDRPSHCLTVPWQETQPPSTFSQAFRSDELPQAD